MLIKSSKFEDQGLIPRFMLSLQGMTAVREVEKNKINPAKNGDQCLILRSVLDPKIHISKVLPLDYSTYLNKK